MLSHTSQMKLLRSFLFALAFAGVLPFSGQSQTSVPGPPADPTAQLPPIRTSVTVNSAVSTEAPAAITVLDQGQISLIPGVNIDDRLRQVPGFSLFRRSSSLVANPTTQGVSLRAIGSTGASRSLVLWDGIPINDPFGGWVYWDRVDPVDIDRVEVDRGASTSLFGDLAMAGTISMFSPQERHEQFFGSVMAGNDGTAEVSGGYSNLWGRWGLEIHSRELTTDGYYIVPESIRGKVDTKANLRFASGDTHIDYLGDTDRFSLHLDILAEERQNGTELTHNSTGLGTIGATYTHSWSSDQISFLAFHTQEQFHSTYSSVSLDRDTERLTSKQTVPADNVGGAAYWQHHAKDWDATVGADVDDTHGTSNDFSYSTLILTRSGGTLLEHGVFAQGDYKLGRVEFFAGIRHQFTGRGERFISPNAGVAVGAGSFRFRASGYRSFRAPTLNELFRSFRVGNVLTLANAALLPEQLVGAEAGVDWHSEGSQVSLGLFNNNLSNLILNSTLSTSPTMILRQRANFPNGYSRGFEANAVHRWRHWTGQAGYLFADARLATGPRLAQVPKQQGTG